MRSVEMVPIEKIQVLNPRVRNRRHHREIVDNIDAIGLKRPITVSRRQHPEGEIEFDLVCGQGRLEAYQMLGQSQIPAFVISAKEEDCLVMSLVENVARRQHPAIELMHGIENLHQRGYNETEIADKLGVTSSWISMLLGLLERGEERLVAAVETGLIPISLAVDIARSDDAGIQEALAEAYTNGSLRGKKVGVVRRLLERRSRISRKVSKPTYGRRGSRKLTAEYLRRIYEREVDKQKLLAKRAEFTQTRLLFVTRALSELRAIPAFVALAREEGIDTIPAALEKSVTARAVR